MISHSSNVMSSPLIRQTTPPGVTPVVTRCAGLGIWIPSVLSAFSVASLVVVATLDRIHYFQSAGSGSPIGWIAIFACVILYGSFGLPIKAPAVLAVKPHAVLFQVYMNVGTLVTLLLFTSVLSGYDALRHPPMWGFLASVAYIGSSIGATIGIRGLGYGIAVAVWAGVTIVVSFVWGACVLGQTLKSVVGSIFALLILNLAVILAASSSQIRFEARSVPLEVGHAEHENLEEEISSATSKASDSPGGACPMAGEKLKGLLAMICGAVLNGSLTVPYQFFSRSLAEDNASAVEFIYLAHFAIGIALCTILMTLLFLMRRETMYPKILALPGFLTGFYWACGNVCAVYATRYLGNTVGYPLCQCSVIISGLWGILYYKEIRAWQAICMWAMAVILVMTGAGLLAVWAGN